MTEARTAEPDIQQAFRKAIYNRDIKQMEKLISQGAKVECVD